MQRNKDNLIYLTYSINIPNTINRSTKAPNNFKIPTIYNYNIFLYTDYTVIQLRKNM